MTIETPRYGEKSENIKPSSKFQITNIMEPNPLVKLSNKEVNDDNTITDLITTNDQVYKTKWSKLIGNDLIFNENGDLISKVSEHLSWCSNVQFVEKKIDEGKVKMAGADNNTSFYKKMLSKLAEKEGTEDSLDMDVD